MQERYDVTPLDKLFQDFVLLLVPEDLELGQSLQTAPWTPLCTDFSAFAKYSHEGDGFLWDH